MPAKNSAASDEEKNIGIVRVQEEQKLENGISLPEPNLDLNEDAIFEAATDYRKWKYLRFTLEDLPAFDNSALFGITVGEEDTQIREEIKKLVTFVASKKPPLFDSYGTLKTTSAEGFDDLYNIAEQIMAGMQIILHDNACLALDHYVHEVYFDLYKLSRVVLRRRYLGKTAKITGHRPILLPGKTRNTQAYHAVLDFIICATAWWLVHVLDRTSWRAKSLAVLARWSVKLKLIALDPGRWAEMSLARGESILRRISSDQKDENRVSIEFPSGAVEADKKKATSLEDRDLDFFYYMRKHETREYLFHIFRHTLNNLKTETARSARSTAFDVRSLIYRAGLDKTLRQLTVRQDSTVSVSSNPASLRRDYLALRLLFSNVKSIVENSSASRVVTVSSEAANFNWLVKSKGSIWRGSFQTAQIDDLVSALVPLSLLGNSDIINALERLLRQKELDEDPSPVAPDPFLEDAVRIEFSLSTRQITTKAVHKDGMEVIPSSRSPLVTTIEDTNTGDFGTTEFALKTEALEALRECKKRLAEIDSWVVNEDSVLVRTKRYSGVVMAVAIAIIAGGLAVPFVVGDGIPAVDPFQITTFGWLLAGAFLVVAKSRRVENWPWHDFLRRQVVCRSVRELAKASRLSEQAVLLYLLDHEFRSPLVFRGPYHGVFRRHVKDGARGFNIDVAATHATILAAGFIVQGFFDPEDKEMKVSTLLRDTRVGAVVSAGSMPLVFSPAENQDDEREGRRSKSGPERPTRLKLADEQIGEEMDWEILGLPVENYVFT